MTEQLVTQWIIHYGYLAVFFLLIFGIIGLPIPDEWLLVLAGYLVFRDILGFVPTVLVAGMGSICGLTASYFLGRTSTNLLFGRHGSWFSISEENLRRAEHWFQNLGRWTLVVGPFIPGIRNLMGYVAGASRLKLHVFARFAYTGAVISSLTFISFGYFAGKHITWAYSRTGLIALPGAILLGLCAGVPFGKRAFKKWKLPATASTSVTEP
jgi:membrane protein DedA with SNARE-associated domain